MIDLIKRVYRIPKQYKWNQSHKFDWHAKERREREKQAERDYKEARGRV